jgi:YggT family protein
LPLARAPGNFSRVDTALSAFDALIGVVRVAVFVIALVAAVIFLVDWLVRTRRIGPFNPVARTFRRVVQPALLPIEQRVIRAGGMPSNAPWWALIVVVLSGIVVIVVLQFVHRELYLATRYGAMGARGLYLLLVNWTFGILQLALIVRVIASWLRIAEWKVWIRWAVVLTEPILRPLRRLIPPLGMMDVTPLVAWFGLWLLKGFFTGI